MLNDSKHEVSLPVFAMTLVMIVIGFTFYYLGKADGVNSAKRLIAELYKGWHPPESADMVTFDPTKNWKITVYDRSGAKSYDLIVPDGNLSMPPMTREYGSKATWGCDVARKICAVTQLQ